MFVVLGEMLGEREAMEKEALVDALGDGEMLPVREGVTVELMEVVKEAVRQSVGEPDPVRVALPVTLLDAVTETVKEIEGVKEGEPLTVPVVELH